MSFELFKTVTPLTVQVDIIGTTKVYKDDTYTVSVTHKKLHHNSITPSIIHLVICRHDNLPIHEWYAFQNIKNELIGPEYTAVEVYPAESMLTDAANCYHLWVFPSSDFKLPFTLHSHRVVVPR